jgi:cobalt-zinc-cadmium efflux system outer membrane protein
MMSAVERQRSFRGRSLCLMSLPTFVLLLSQSVRAQSDTPYKLPSDPVLSQLIKESLSARPEIIGTEAAVRAETARIPQAGAMPDPMLQVGIQNDGFKSIEIGKMETSYVSIAASQTFPWPGKQRLQRELAKADEGKGKRSVERLRLSTEALVRSNYIALLLVRDRKALLDRRTGIWTAASEVARTVYENGGGSQSDMLRAQLELLRLKQERISLEAEERALILNLNRLRNHPSNEAIRTPVRLADLVPPDKIDTQAALNDAIARSPELAASRLELEASGTSVGIAKKSFFPDPIVNTGIMLRGGNFPPMWAVSVGGTLPVYAKFRQNRAVDEAEARKAASRAEVDAVEQLLRLRVEERLSSLAALNETIRLYREGLLVQSETVAGSTLIQYQIGKASFASVLEAEAGYVSDEETYLQTIAEAELILIAAFEVSLDPVAIPDGGEER